MDKTISTIYIDRDLKRKAKRMGINLSALAEQVLLDELKKRSANALVQEKDIDISTLEKRIEETKKRIEEKDLKRKKLNDDFIGKEQKFSEQLSILENKIELEKQKLSQRISTLKNQIDAEKKRFEVRKNKIEKSIMLLKSTLEHKRENIKKEVNFLIKQIEIEKNELEQLQRQYEEQKKIDEQKQQEEQKKIEKQQQQQLEEEQKQRNKLEKLETKLNYLNEKLKWFLSIKAGTSFDELKAMINEYREQNRDNEKISNWVEDTENFIQIIGFVKFKNEIDKHIEEVRTERRKVAHEVEELKEKFGVPNEEENHV